MEWIRSFDDTGRLSPSRTAVRVGSDLASGTVNPDEFYVFKPTLIGDLRPILQKKLGTKEFKLACRGFTVPDGRNLMAPIRQRGSISTG